MLCDKQSYTEAQIDKAIAMLTSPIPDYHAYLPSAVANLENPQTDTPRIAKDASLLKEIENGSPTNSDIAPIGPGGRPQAIVCRR